MSVMRFSTAICSAIVPPDDEPAECDADGEFWRCRLPPPLPALPELPPLLLWLPAGLGTLMDISSGAATPPPLPLLPLLPLLPPPPLSMASHLSPSISRLRTLVQWTASLSLVS